MLCVAFLFYNCIDYWYSDIITLVLQHSTPSPLPPLGHIWDVVLDQRKGNINKTVSVLHLVCYAQRYEQFLQVNRLYRALILLGLAFCLELLCIFGILYIVKKIYHIFLYLLVNWAWWYWPLTWLTNHSPSVLWRCWLGHMTHNIISKMTYNVSSGTLNPTIPYHDSRAPQTSLCNCTCDCGKINQII